MRLFRLWYHGKERGKNFLVTADGTDEAKQLVADYLNVTANFHTPSMFAVGFTNKYDSEWITVWVKEPGGWGFDVKTSSTAWEEWERCKDRGIKKVITEYKP